MDDANTKVHYVDANGEMKELAPGAVTFVPSAPKFWFQTMDLKFIRDGEGRAILHQLWTSSQGERDWRPIPLEEGA